MNVYTLFTLYSKFWKYFLNFFIIQSPGLLPFLLFFISFYISRCHFSQLFRLHSILYTWKWNKIFSWISVLLMDLPTPFHPHRYPFNCQNLLGWHKYLVCAPITGLKLSFLVCKTGFYRPKHKAKGDLMELSFKGLEMQK